MISSADLLIVPVCPADKKAVLAMFRREKGTWPWGGGVIWHRFWKTPGRTEQWLKAIDSEGQLVGFVHFAQTLDNTKNVYDIAVHPALRGHGVGRSLIDAVGLPICLKTDDGSESEGFYTRLGFTRGPTAVTRNRQKFVTTYTKEQTLRTPPGPNNPGITVFTGRMVNPLALRPEDVTVPDIAHGLALVNRFAGHSVKPISVAQHSVYVSRICEEVSEDLAWEALWHDGSEAYLGDMPKWVKQSPLMLNYRVAEDDAQTAIGKVVGIYPPDAISAYMSPEVKEADRLMVRFEARQAFGKAWINPNGYPDCTPEELERIGKWAAWPWRKAEEAFLTQFRLLNGPERMTNAAVALAGYAGRAAGTTDSELGQGLAAT